MEREQQMEFVSRSLALTVVTFSIVFCGNINKTFAASKWIEDSWNNKVIYGKDDRLDLYGVQNETYKKVADSTVALVFAKDVQIDANTGVAQLTTENYGTANGLCQSEQFYDQPTAAFCSGSLVGPDLIMTAGHCIGAPNDPSIACENVKFVFGFGVQTQGIYPTSVDANEVYNCSQVVARLQDDKGADYALVRLDRTVGNHSPLKIERSGKIKLKTPLVVIGHPYGLPTKVAGGATVRSVKAKAKYFVANLDTYGGNSGSAVFNADSGLIEGILVRGQTDFKYDSVQECSLSNVCSDETGCASGNHFEDVTAISALMDLIPKLSDEQ